MQNKCGKYGFGSVSARFSGYLGELTDRCIRNGVMKTDYQNFIDVFKEKTDSDGLFCGEFWGKWFTSAVLAYEYERTPEHLAVLESAVIGIMDAQEEDGRLSCSARDFSDWDLWGRKYVLLGLLAYYDISLDAQVLRCAERMTGNLIETLSIKGKKITDTGLQLLQGISSCSLLQPVVRLYQRTQNKKYLDFAEELTASWSKESLYNHEGIRLLEKALEGISPVEIAVPKAYEVMSCLEGVLELYQAAGKEEYYEAVCRYMENVLEREIMITGSGSSGELWCDGAYRQTQILETPMETCVTATFMKICAALLCESGDIKWADQLEISLYNALLGAMKEDGSWWAYFSPLQGQRVLSPVQIERVHSSCCVVNGPRALLEVPKWAVMRYEKGVAVQLYEDGTYIAGVDGEILEIKISGDYPRDGKVRITLVRSPTKTFGIRLRIPAFARNSAVRTGGRNYDCIPGSFWELEQSWKPQDVIELDLDMNVRIVTAPANISYKAVMAGPVVLAMDSRKIQSSWKAVRLMNTNMKWKLDDQTNIRYVLSQSLEQESDIPEAERVECKDTYVAYKVKFLYKPIHFFDHEEVELLLCDYASCGKGFREDESIRVWMPQPMFLNEAFPYGTKCIVAGTKGEVKNL